MASTDNTSTTPTTPGDANSNHSTSTTSTVEAKRKVSILTDPPAVQEKGSYYDNLAYEGSRRKISQVRHRRLTSKSIP